MNGRKTIIFSLVLVGILVLLIVLKELGVFEQVYAWYQDMRDKMDHFLK